MLEAGPVPYAFWLSSIGHEVHLIDPIPKHIHIASQRNAAEKDKLASIQIGEAQLLPFPDETFDMALLMGPLYHLSEPADRLMALTETSRILKHNGMLFAAHISRFASLLDGYRSALINDPEFRSIVLEDLSTGKHRGSRDGTGKYFTNAYLQQPEKIEGETAAVGLEVIAMIAVESFGWMIPKFDECWNDLDKRTILLDLIDRIEQEKSLMGISPHIMIVARKG